MSQSPIVNPNDPALVSGTVQYPGDGVTLSAYRSRPKGDGRYPAVIVIHENRGLVEHIQDVARRFAKAGFLGIAPDFLSRRGGTKSFATSDAATEGIRAFNRALFARPDFTSLIVPLRDGVAIARKAP